MAFTKSVTESKIFKFCLLDFLHAMAMKSNPVSAVLKIVLDKVKFLLDYLFVNYHPVFVHAVVFPTVNQFVLYALVLLAA